MLSFKVLLVITAFVAVNSASLPGLLGDSLKICDSTKANKLVYQASVVEEGKFLAKVEKKIVWPTTVVNKEEITCIMVIDQDTNGHGGHVSLISGGISEKEVEIDIKSQTSRGLNYLVSIYTA